MEQTMREIVGKAATLIEALPYIQKFNNKIVVVKYGGSAMTDETLQLQVIQDVALLKSVGMRPIIVHGGGKEISKWVSLLGKTPQFIQGLRVTDEETMEVAEMVLNKVNKQLVQLLSQVGMKAVGISGKDGGTLQVEKKVLSSGEDLGYVGNVTAVDTTLLSTLLDTDFIPVVAPVGIGADHHGYNINADDAACAVAEAMGAEKLAFLTDIEGVYRDFSDPDSLISEMTVEEANALLRSGMVGGGMLPKIANCVYAVQHGVGRVHILDGRQPHCLLLEFFTNQGVGTVFIREREE